MTASATSGKTAATKALSGRSAGGGGDRPAHRDPNVLRWLTAYAASMLGDGVFFVALGFAAAKVAPPAEVGVVMAVGSVPRAALMLGGGVVADRFGPRRVVIGSDAVRSLLILGAAAAVALASPGLWLLVAVAFVFGVVDALFMPAVGALPPRLVAPDQLVRLQGMRALTVRLGTIVGPPLGGVAMGLGGAGVAFALAGGLFAVSVPLLVATRIGGLPPRVATGPAGSPAGAGSGELASGPDAERGTGAWDELVNGSPAGAGAGDLAARPDGERELGAWDELVDGLRYLRRHPLVGPLVVSGALCELGLVGPLNIGMILLAEDRGWGSSGYGWIVGAFGVGAALSALLLTVKGRLPRAGAVQIGTLFAGSAAIGLIAVVPALAAAVALALLAGLICGICGGLAFALIQAATDPGYLGRVTSVMSLTGFGLAPLAYPLFGAAVAAWGLAPVFLVSAAFGTLGGVVSLLTPAVRSAELPRNRGAGLR